LEKTSLQLVVVVCWFYFVGFGLGGRGALGGVGRFFKIKTETTRESKKWKGSSI